MCTALLRTACSTKPVGSVSQALEGDPTKHKESITDSLAVKPQEFLLVGGMQAAKDLNLVSGLQPAQGQSWQAPCRTRRRDDIMASLASISRVMVLLAKVFEIICMVT